MVEKTIGIDKFFRTIGLHRSAIASVKNMNAESLSMLQAYADGINDYRDRIKRKDIETQLGQMTGANPNFNQPIIKYVTSAEKLGGLWSTLTEYRNDIAHAQMRPADISAATLEEYAQNKLVQGLSELLPEFTA
jgi:acyl-homoserine lactone acylase PvdQ